MGVLAALLCAVGHRVPARMVPREGRPGCLRSAGSTAARWAGPTRRGPAGISKDTSASNTPVILTLSRSGRRMTIVGVCALSAVRGVECGRARIPAIDGRGIRRPTLKAGADDEVAVRSVPCQRGPQFGYSGPRRTYLMQPSTKRGHQVRIID